MGALLFGGGSRPRPVAPAPPVKPISPVTNRATEEGIIRRRRRRSLATDTNRSLLNEESEPLGTVA